MNDTYNLSYSCDDNITRKSNKQELMTITHFLDNWKIIKYLKKTEKGYKWDISKNGI